MEHCNRFPHSWAAWIDLWALNSASGTTISLYMLWCRLTQLIWYGCQAQCCAHEIRMTAGWKKNCKTVPQSQAKRGDVGRRGDGWMDRTGDWFGAVDEWETKRKHQNKKKGAGQMKRKEKRAKIISNEQRRVKLKS